MLPILKKRQQTGVITTVRQADDKEDESNHGLKACAQDLINAVHAHDVDAVAAALKAAFEIADSEPHVEGEHVEPHSYDAQNIKAAE